MQRIVTVLIGIFISALTYASDEIIYKIYLLDTDLTVTNETDEFFIEVKRDTAEVIGNLGIMNLYIKVRAKKDIDEIFKKDDIYFSNNLFDCKNQKIATEEVMLINKYGKIKAHHTSTEKLQWKASPTGSVGHIVQTLCPDKVERVLKDLNKNKKN